jgi:hypothetical protein
MLEYSKPDHIKEVVSSTVKAIRLTKDMTPEQYLKEAEFRLTQTLNSLKGGAAIKDYALVIGPNKKGKTGLHVQVVGQEVEFKDFLLSRV